MNRRATPREITMTYALMLALLVGLALAVLLIAHGIRGLS